jgi:hypothetical protein
MEHCESLMANEEDGPTPSHPLDERQKALMGTTKGANSFSLTEFLQDGIEEIPKMKFKDLKPSLQEGDQLWIYRSGSTTRCNPVASMMPYAHVVVYVGNNEVVHVAKDTGCCKGILKGTIKTVSIENVIKPNDQGEVPNIYTL